LLILVQQAQDDDDDDVPSTSQRPRTQRRLSPAEEDDVDATQVTQTDNDSFQTMVKSLVRLALSSEYTRHPIRRADITTKVLLTQGRQFKNVFDAAQLALRQTFGMEMVELPAKEKVTMIQKRQAQKSGSSGSGSASAASKSWILRSTLPEKYRIPEILPPPKVPTQEMEAAYVGLYSFIVGVIMLGGGRLPEAKLERYLKRTNADQSTPVDSRDKLLARMEREGYIQRAREMNAGEETVEYLVGPRGKMEIGEAGVAGFVKAVYGETFDEDAAKRLERSMKMVVANRALTDGGKKDGEDGETTRKARGRPRKEAAGQAEEESSDEE